MALDESAMTDLLAALRAGGGDARLIEAAAAGLYELRRSSQ
jgi:hypothetical protein